MTDIFYDSFFMSALDRARSLTVEIYGIGSINVLDCLKRIDRTGKKLRLEKMGKGLIRIRTIYDHIHSLAKMADILLRKGIIDCEGETLANFIIYHDMCECIIGDFPNYTKGYETYSVALENVRKVKKSIREDYVNKLLWVFADENQKKCFEELKREDNIKVAFEVMDKIDPIVNIWRYIYCCQDIITPRIDEYIDVMSDFFEFPVLQEIIKNNRFPVLSEMIGYLRNKENARMYAQQRHIDRASLSVVTCEITKELIEGTSLYYN